MKDIQYILVAQASPTNNTQIQNSIPTTGAKSNTNIPKENAPQSFFTPLLFPILLLVAFYFLLIRPQQKKEKERKESLKTLKKGDKVLTRGGILAHITDVKDENTVKLKISDNTIITINTQYVDVVNPINETKKSETKK